MHFRVFSQVKQTSFGSLTFPSIDFKDEIETLWTKYLRTNLFPFLMIIGGRIAVYYLSIVGTEKDLSWSESLFGNSMSWMMTLVMAMWAFLSLKIPSKLMHGPVNQFGISPSYPDNATFYYLTTSAIFLAICYIYRSLPHIMFFNFPHLIASLNIVSYALFIALWVKGKYFPDHEEVLEPAPFIFEIYRGIELNPRIFGADVKQLVNNRFGMMVWQLLLFSYWIISYDKFGFNWGMAVNATLQTLYVFKFLYYERNYFFSIDVCLDRAGFHICWGCVALIPSLCVFSTRYFVAHAPIVSKSTALILFCLGLICCAIVTLIDLEKDIFKSSDGKRCLWNDQPTYIEAVYETTAGKREAKILTSGFWGVARHLNYGFEIANYCMWSLPGYNFGIYPFLYCVVLVFLLIHRTYRDDQKGLNKYGAAWQKYCKLVPYKIIPYVY